MCFRFQQSGSGDYFSADDYSLIEAFLGQSFGIEQLPSSFTYQSNIALTDMALSVTNEAPRQARMLRFSMIPYGTKDPKSLKPNYYGNATREKLASSPVWKFQFQRKRCLIPVSGFYDWITDANDPKVKTPYMAYVPDEPFFSLAGIWDQWIDPATGNEVRSFAIITSPPNELWAKIHNRMPVIVPPEKYEQWLAPNSEPDMEALANLLQIYPANNMAYREFSRSVNSSKNKNEVDLIPVGNPITI